MHDIDLIPAAWRDRVRIERWLGWLALALVGLLLCLGATRGALAWLIAGERPAVQRLRAEQAAAERERAQRSALALQLKASRRRLAAAEALRGGPLADPVFLALDAALSEAVRFHELRVARPMPAVTPAALAEGKLPAELPPELAIRGEAGSYAALAAFAEALGRQPGIAGARVASSGSPGPTAGGVQFTLLAALAAPAGQGR